MKLGPTVALVIAALALGCSPDGQGFGDGGRDAGTRADGTAGDTGTPADGAVGRPDVRDPLLTPDTSCAMSTSATQRAPMNLLLVLDRSGSMGDNGKWAGAVRGITALLDRLDSAARVGLVLFPAASNPDTEASYQRPAVPVAPLATSRAQITDLLARTTPSGGTPMACAIPGALAYYQSMFALDGSRSIVLITDGAPTDECSGLMCSPFDVNCLLRASGAAKIRIQATIAGAGRATPPVRAFVVGTTDADDAFLTNLAINGGTPQGPGCETTNTCHYSLGSSSFESDLNRALDAIRGRAASCEFTFTIDPAVADPTLVNVNYTPGGGAARLVPRDTTHTDGWDYGPDMRSILLHGATCDQVRTDPDGVVQILFGCPTVTPG